MRTRTIVAIIVLAVLAAFGLQLAAASKITLQAGSPGTFKQWSRCSGNTLAITITGTAVAVTGIDGSACSGATLKVLVRSGGTTQSATTTVSGSTASLTLSNAVTAADGVTATLETWTVPVTWKIVTATVPTVSCASLDDPGQSCTATITNFSSWGYPTNNEYILDLKLTSTSTTAFRWVVTINLSSSTFPFVADKLNDGQGGLVLVSASSCSASPRLVAVKGTTNWGTYNRVSSTLRPTIEVHAVPSGTGGLINCS